MNGPLPTTPSASATHPLAAWQGSRVFRAAFDECVAASRTVHAVCARLLPTVAAEPNGFTVTMGATDPSLLTWQRNLFSTVFQSTYLLLDIPPARRALFAQLNHLFRIWVTSADNILDGEDKSTLPLEMPPGARVMRQVVAVMLADRSLTRILGAATRDGVVTSAEADRLLERSLTVLLPSAALEGAEEQGVVAHPLPQDVLDKVHHLKTGILFTVPFIGLEDAADNAVPPGRARRLRDALATLGAGCQILDDIRDFARDLATRRHNYLSSVLFHEDRSCYEALLARQESADARLYQAIPSVVQPAVAEATRRLLAGLAVLRSEGLDLSDGAAADVVGSLFRVLDVEDVWDV